MDLIYASSMVNTGKSRCLVNGLIVHRGPGKAAATYAVTERLSAASSASPLHSLKT